MSSDVAALRRQIALEGAAMQQAQRLTFEAYEQALRTPLRMMEFP
ncbi:MAG TPA: hypothetical protein VFB60_11085 [Ktedonobacteraceae bacterium]|nr:hypothetical protein [Ktedonobacteraceae bacterium]